MFYIWQRSYPPPTLPFSTLDQIKTAVDNILSLNRPYYDFGLTGGEPTIHPHIFDIISLLHEALQERLNSITITTNGSRNNDLYEKLLDVAKHTSLKFMISIHTDHVEMDHILDLIEKFSKNTSIQFALMFNPEKREMVRDIYKTLLECRKNFPFTMAVTTLRDGDHIDPRYTEEDLNWQKKTATEFQSVVKSVSGKVPMPKNTRKHWVKVFHEIEDGGERKIIETKNRTLNFKNGLLRFQGMYCVTYATCLHIVSNGFCRGIVCNVDRPLGNIYKEKDIFKKVRDKLIRCVKCPLHTCGCVANDRIPKFASEEDAKKYIEFAQKRQAELFAEYDAAHSIKTI